MVRLTLIARQRDGLPLAEGLDNDKDPDLTANKQQAKQMFKKLSAQRSSAPERLSAEAGTHTFHILNSDGVCFLTLAERSYPKKLAFQYLEELSNEFNRLYGGQQVDSVSRPYAFIKFDTFIQKTKKLYLDTRTQRNITKLQTDVQEVATIMTKNIAEILGQGEKMSDMATMSSALVEESKKYKKSAQKLYNSAIFQKFLPWAILAGIVLLVLVFKWLYS